MNKRHNDTISTNILYSDMGSNSFNRSQIFQQSNYRNNRLISSSLQYFKSPYQQTLPLKFPNRRIRGQCQHHILQQTQVSIKRPCIRLSELRNKQCQQTIWRQQVNVNKFKQDVFQQNKRLSNIYNHSNSLQLISCNISPSNRSKKQFPEKIIIDCIKNPILIGEQHKRNTGLKIHVEKRSQNLLQWNINKSVQKQRFKQRYNNQSINNNRNYNKPIKIQDKNTNKYGLNNIRRQKQRTYTQLHNQRKRK